MAANIELTLKDVMLSFPSLFSPKKSEFKDAQGNVTHTFSYECNLIIDRDDPQVETVKKAIRTVLSEEWPNSPPTIPADRRCLRSGMVEDPDTGEQKARWDGYDGKVFVSCRRKVQSPHEPNPVQIIDGIRGPVDPETGKRPYPRLKESDGKIYAGAKVNAIIRIYAYNGAKDGNPHRINASIEAVQFAGHGEKFGAKPVDVDSAFDEVEGLMEDGFSDGSGAQQGQSNSAIDDELL
ncbi:ssDNA-binding protein [Alterisphingorhabdus coralli]|uniref:DUF2815 family protein n=1 Tax=Alterisphingorhabdus coralli TaxID=3071408 RepID=A0AA97I1S1_9SPHN|nr:ssDNA-binding protein [Parasphingorhabdus sp. SCSIO 66989]WOE76367.1 DUF2815 family protein [Parasphingorhabdus sp. SCSIO 66989]